MPESKAHSDSAMPKGRAQSKSAMPRIVNYIGGAISRQDNNTMTHESETEEEDWEKLFGFRERIGSTITVSTARCRKRNMANSRAGGKNSRASITFTKEGLGGSLREKWKYQGWNLLRGSALLRGIPWKLGKEGSWKRRHWKLSEHCIRVRNIKCAKHTWAGLGGKRRWSLSLRMACTNGTSRGHDLRREKSQPLRAWLIGMKPLSHKRESLGIRRSGT